MSETTGATIESHFAYLFEPELIKEMQAHGQTKRLSAGTQIMEIGDNVEYMPLLMEGSIKVMTEDDEGQDLLLYYLEPGDTCAVTLNCCNRSTKSSIRAVIERDSLLHMVDVDKMDEWMATYKSWRSFVLESYNNRLQEMLTAIDNLVFNSMPQRLRSYLKDKVWAQKSTTIETSHAQIANDLHSSRVVISRLMKQLEKEGLIKQYRGKIEVLDIN